MEQRKEISVAIAQINTMVGNIEYNKNKIIQFYYNALDQNIDLIVFPELAITGYPLEDLALSSSFYKKSNQALQEIVNITQNNSTAIIIGSIRKYDDEIYNSAFFIHQGKVLGIVDKQNLPNYGVFDEKRIFTVGRLVEPINFYGINIGILICEDAWYENNILYNTEQGATILICLNASPFELNKYQERVEVLSNYASIYNIPIIYVNLIGAQDGLVFDGGSFALNRDGHICFNEVFFQESLSIIALTTQDIKDQTIVKPYTNLESIYQALILGLRDYVEKNNFNGVMLGLSGGIDSAFCAAIAVDAFGSGKVKSFMLSTIYNSNDSLQDAQICANNMGIDLQVIEIQNIYETILKDLSNYIDNENSNITHENIQSRIRGLVLMALSNQTGYLLLSAGNKSEIAVGYSTIYGDMCGGFNPLKDLYKTQIYELAKWRNKNIPIGAKILQLNIIPDNIINKSPSAELRPNQTDQDSLPPYDLLDKILYQLIEQQLSVDEIINFAYDKDIVDKIAKLLYSAEFKRRQSAPGIKISSMSFNLDRRYPITNGFKL